MISEAQGLSMLCIIINVAYRATTFAEVATSHIHPPSKPADECVITGRRPEVGGSYLARVQWNVGVKPVCNARFTSTAPSRTPSMHAHASRRMMEIKPA